MKFSVVIPNWNGKKFLKQCLDSLKRQEFKDFEIIVVDNGSEDGSVQFIETHYPEVRIVKLSKNYGFSKAVNDGIKEAKGELVFLLNNDTEVAPDCLYNCKQAIQNYPDNHIFALRIMNYKTRDVIESVGICYPKSGRGYNRGIGLIFSREFNRSQRVFGFCGGGAIIRKSIFEEIGYFDEDFFAYFEDVDLSFKARLLGYECIYIPDAVIYHIGSGFRGKEYRKKIYYLHRNFIWTVIKNWPVNLFIKYSSLIIFYDILATLNSLIFDRSFATVKAKIDAFNSVPKMLNKRHWIQKNRRISAREVEKWLAIPEKPIKIFERKRGK